MIDMTMHTVFSKEHEEEIVVDNPIGQLSSAAVASEPWWSGLGSQLVNDDASVVSVGQFKASSPEHPHLASGGQLTSTCATEQAEHEHRTEQGLDRGLTTQFTIFPVSYSGDWKTSANRENPSQLLAAISMQSILPEYHSHFELGLGQPVTQICGKYPYGDQCYGVLSTYGPQITGRIMLPLDLTADDGPIYVNAKQYHGIIKRRLSRAKAESESKALRVRKPYLHLSRHLHAMRRPRGCGGRFINTKTLNDGKGRTETEKTGNGQLFQPTESQNFELEQRDDGYLNSPKEGNGRRSNLSRSKVTSMFSKGDLNCFVIKHLRPSVHSLSNMMNTGHGVDMSSKWVAATDSRCNLKV